MVSVVETIDKPFQSNEDNITSTINLLESIHKYVPNIKSFSSLPLFVYGRLEDLPKTIESKVDPLSPYLCSEICKRKVLKNLS